MQCLFMVLGVCAVRAVRQQAQWRLINDRQDERTEHDEQSKCGHGNEEKSPHPEQSQMTDLINADRDGGGQWSENAWWQSRHRGGGKSNH